MAGSDVPPWRTTIFGGGQTVGAVADGGLEVPAFEGSWVDPPEEATGGEAGVAAEAGTQLDAGIFFLRRRGRAVTDFWAGGV